MNHLKKHPDGIIIPIRITAKSSQNQITGWENTELRIRLATVPERGSANAELIRFLAKTFKISKSRVVLLRGETSRHKQVLILDVSTDEIEKIIS
jgi:uncharacterized protein